MLSYSSSILIALAALLVTCHALSKCPGISGIPGIPGRNGLKGKQTCLFCKRPMSQRLHDRKQVKQKDTALKEADVLSTERKREWRKWGI